MDKDLKILLKIISILLFLASVGSFIYGIVTLVQYIQARNMIGNNNVVIYNMKVAFITSLVIGVIGMSVFGVLIKMLFSPNNKNVNVNKKIRFNFKMPSNMFKVMLHILNALLLVTSIGGFIYGILILANKVNFYVGNSYYSSYNDCMSTNPRDCGINPKTVGGLLIGFGLFATIIFGNLFRKYTLNNFIYILRNIKYLIF